MNFMSSRSCSSKNMSGTLLSVWSYFAQVIFDFGVTHLFCSCNNPFKGIIVSSMLIRVGK